MDGWTGNGQVCERAYDGVWEGGEGGRRGMLEEGMEGGKVGAIIELYSYLIRVVLDSLITDMNTKQLTKE